MAPGRKLFLTHAGELAHRLMHDVGRDGRDGLVASFVRSYAERHGRRGLLSDRARLLELASTIGREALLVMAADVGRRVPQVFSPGPKGALRSDDAAFVEAFYAEFLASLARSLEWSAGDAGETVSEAPSEAKLFRRDLEMYRQWRQRPSTTTGAAAAAHAHESPFRDRCALLLDPAMMEQARRAAADFEREILRTAAKRFGQLGRFRAFAAAAPRRRSAKAPVRRGAKAPVRRGAKAPIRRAARLRRRRAKVPRRSAKRTPARRSAKPPRRKKRKAVGRRLRARG